MWQPKSKLSRQNLKYIIMSKNTIQAESLLKCKECKEKEKVFSFSNSYWAHCERCGAICPKCTIKKGFLKTDWFCPKCDDEINTRYNR